MPRKKGKKGGEGKKGTSSQPTATQLAAQTEAEALRREQVAAEVAKRKAEAAAAAVSVGEVDDEAAAAAVVLGEGGVALTAAKERAKKLEGDAAAVVAEGEPVVMMAAAAPVPSSTGAMLSSLPGASGDVPADTSLVVEEGGVPPAGLGAAASVEFHVVDPLVGLSAAQREILRGLDEEVESVSVEALPGETPYPKYLVAYQLQVAVALYESSWTAGGWGDAAAAELRTKKLALAQLLVQKACSHEYSSWDALLAELGKTLTDINEVGRYVSRIKGQGPGNFASFVSLVETLLARLNRQHKAEYWIEQILAPSVCPDLEADLPKEQALSLLGLANATKAQLDDSLFLNYVDRVYRVYLLPTELVISWQSSFSRYLVHHFGDAGEKFKAKKAMLLKGLADTFVDQEGLSLPRMRRRVLQLCQAAITENADIEATQSAGLQQVASALSSAATVAATATSRVAGVASDALSWAWSRYQGAPETGVGGGGASAVAVEPAVDSEEVVRMVVKFSLADFLICFKEELERGADSVAAMGASSASLRK